MKNPELSTYIQEERTRGVSVEAITDALNQAGWDERSIEEAFKVQTIPDSFEPKKLPGILILLKETFRIYVKNFLNISLLSTFSPGFLLILASFFLREASAVLYLIGFGLIGFPILRYGGIGYLVSRKDTHSSMKSVIKESLKKIPNLLITSVALHLILASFTLFLIAPFGYILTIILSVVFSLTLPIATQEHMSGFAAMMASKRLTQDRRTGLLIRIILLVSIPRFVFDIIIFILFSLNPNSFMSVFLGLANIPTTQFISTLGILCALVYNYVFIPLEIIVFFLLYNQLKNIHGSIDASVTKKEKFLFLLALLVGLVVTAALFLLAFFFVLIASSEYGNLLPGW